MDEGFICIVCVCMHVYVYIYIYFKNTGYLLVKVALLFSLENFPKLYVSRGRLVFQPPFVWSRHLGNLALAAGQGTSVNCSRTYCRNTVFLCSYFLHRYSLFITIFYLISYTQLLKSDLQTFCKSAVLFRVC